MAIEKSIYGKTTNGKDVYIYKLSNNKKSYIEVINYGGIIVSAYVPDNKGIFNDVILGFDNLADYENNDSCYFGAIIGRFANIIEDGLFYLNNKKYSLYLNDNGNHLHGGKKGFNKVLWKPKIEKDNDGDCLSLSYTSKDDEESYLTLP